MRLLIVLFSAVLGFAVAEKKCTEPGIFLSSDPHKFIVCVVKNGSLETIVNECSKGLVFDIVHKRCTSLKTTSLLALGNILYVPNGVASGTRDNSAAWNPLKCQNPGAICDSCQSLSFCVGTPAAAGSIMPYNTAKILTLQCASGSVCVTGAGCLVPNSRPNGTSLCKLGNFKCGDVGTFPDLYDCTKYHRCETGLNGQPEDTPGQCRYGMFGNRWNPIDSQCGWPENVEACRKYPVPLCSYEFEMGSPGGQIYYICIADYTTNILSPVMFRCPMNLVFDPISYSCRDSSSVTVG
ncbi:hypothetical protein GE061_015283 [Apolygus lucorum]|uniref:Chitin-binding type-2 domain-containing protein n=1 Tax=Apolygus lucorum TaxID=248454 RepID=A0A8S9XPK7_APOLU|nr:hypothetical protein GE061_015283 [Apolygus lucorum]